MAGKLASTAGSKAALRKQIIAARDALPPGARHALSARITTQLLDLEAYRNARRVLAYFRGDAEPLRRPQPARPTIPPAALTQRETEVLRQLAKGHTLAEVGRELTLSVNTVKTHVKNVYARLDVSSRIAAVDTARRMGILDDDTRR